MKTSDIHSESEVIFALSDATSADSVQTHLDRVAIEICYCSVYDQCWHYVQRFGGEDSRSEVERCEATETDFRQ